MKQRRQSLLISWMQSLAGSRKTFISHCNPGRLTITANSNDREGQGLNDKGRCTIYCIVGGQKDSSLAISARELFLLADCHSLAMENGSYSFQVSLHNSFNSMCNISLMLWAASSPRLLFNTWHRCTVAAFHNRLLTAFYTLFMFTFCDTVFLSFTPL